MAKSPERLVFDPILNKLDNIENIVAILLFKMDNFRSYFIYFSQISLLLGTVNSGNTQIVNNWISNHDLYYW